FLPQGKFAEFLRARPSNRRKLLNELLRLLVFDHMRENAGQLQKQNALLKEQTERRLREDFTDVSEESRAELARQLGEQQLSRDEAQRQLPALKLSWDALRCGL